MRREDIRLVASARQGDSAARLEVGRRYLIGGEGFPKHTDTGLGYLRHPSLRQSERASRTIAEAMELHEIVQRDLLPTLMFAARSGSVAAQIKLGLWRSLTNTDPNEAAHWLQVAAAAGNESAKTAAAKARLSSIDSGAAVLCALAIEPGIDPDQVVLLAMAEAARSNNFDLVVRTLNCALKAPILASADLADSICGALVQIKKYSQLSPSIESGKVEAILEDCIRRGNPTAALLLGRAMAGFGTPPISTSMLANGQNLRKGAALLLRAADAGLVEAWALLYRIHADSKASVSNPQMARFFLEKAALAGDAQSQRRLGALILRVATSLQESEQGMHWLYQAAGMQDSLALQLLCSFVLPVAGSDAEASAAIDALRREDPWLSCRLRTARDFGLTKLEAMSVDIVAGIRPWGLVVGPNSSIAQARLAAPRAIPAVRHQAMENLRRSAAFLEQSGHEGAPVKGDRRRRTHRLRYCLDRSGFDEALFFAEARSTMLQSLRQGAKWALRTREPLRLALAA